MLLKSGVTGVTSFSDLQCQKGISSLLIVKSGAAGIVNETINVALQDGSGNQRKVMTLVKVRDVAILSQFGNGYLSQTNLGGGVIKCAYIVELSEGLALDLKDETYLSIDMNGLVSGSTYDIYGIEFPFSAKSYLAYNTTVLSGGESQQKQYSVASNAFEIGIRNNDSLAKVRFFYENGSEVSYLPEELAAITREHNDITQAADNLIEGDSINQVILSGAQEMFYWKLDGVVKFEITTVGGTDVVFFLVTVEHY